MNSEKLHLLCEDLGIAFQAYTHPPLADCSTADSLGLIRSGCRLKNLFLRDNYGRRHFLLLTAHNKHIDLNQLSRQQQVSRLGFASSQRLANHLGIEPGNVSLLALVNDRHKAVELWVDAEIWSEASFQCHPLVNTQTWVLSKQGVLSFVEYTGHRLSVIDVPVRS